MATKGTKLTLLLGLFMAASLLAAAQPDAPDKPDNNKPTVSINNPSLVALDIMVDDKNVRVTTEFATLDINHPEQQIQISVGGGENMEVTVGDGDVIVVVGFPTGAANPQAFKPVVGGEEPLQPDDVAAGVRPLTSRKVLPAPLPHANEPWPEIPDGAIRE